MNRSFVTSEISHASLRLLCIIVGICFIAVPGMAVIPDRPVLPGDNPALNGSGGTASLLGNLSLYFIPNAGQADPAVLFLCKGRDFTIFYAKDKVAYSLPFESNGMAGRYTMIQRFSGASPEPVVEGRDPVETKVSYFTGPETDWHTGITPFSTIAYQGLYPGIDLVYRGQAGTIKREFLVRPDADPSMIRIAYDGADEISVANDGSLLITAGTGELKESPPLCYQEQNGVRTIVPCRFTINEDRTVSFVTGRYDPAIPLLIDPILVYCGYIGGSGDDNGYGIAVDGAGNVYITGQTTSAQSTFPVKVGPDLTFNGGYDAFVAKVNTAGTGLVYCGYIGGSGDEGGSSIAVDGSGNAYITGDTTSAQSTFPVKVGPDLTFNGQHDAFVAKVNAAGTGLVYCGYIGGSAWDTGSGIAVDSAGNAYVTGETESSQATFPEKAGPDLTYNGGVGDAFIAKVNAAGTGLMYCGFIGGSGDEWGRAIAVDSAGNAYVTGLTKSTQSTFPETVGPDLTYNGGDDAFVAKVNAAGTGLTYCGYIGGSADESGFGITVDSAGNAYVTGYTGSSQATFPETVGPDLTYNGGDDAFVAKVNPAGSALVYCGYIGGSGEDYGEAIAVDSTGNAYVTGYAGSSQATFPVRVGPDLTYNGGDDAFVAKVGISPPAITSISPNYGVQGRTVQISNMAGSGFIATPKPTVQLLRGTAIINATNITVVSPNKITCTFAIPAGTVIGPWNVRVTNANGQSGTKANAFMVKTPAPPTVTGITPASARTEMTVQISNLAGTGFVASPKPTVQLRNGTSSLTATNITVVSPTRITCTFGIPVIVTLGPWDVSVTNADQQTGTKIGAFTIKL